MGKLVVTEFITLDGVIEDPGGAEAFEKGGWAFKFKRGDAGDEFKVDELMTAAAQLLGRVTYAGFARAWPAMNTDEFGQKMNSMPKYVVSTTLRDADATWSNSTTTRDEVSGQFARVKSKPARNSCSRGCHPSARRPCLGHSPADPSRGPRQSFR
jgi:dihydrofolate reductase